MNHTERAKISASLEHPPKGTWLRQQGAEFEVGAATRSVTAVLFGLFMSVFSVFPLWGGYSIVKADPRQLKGVIIFALFTVLCDMWVLIWVFGKIVVRVNQEGGVISRGIGRLGLQRHFDWKDVSVIRIIETGEFDYRIALEGKRRIKFGWQLSSERQEFIVAGLNQLRRHYRQMPTANQTLPGKGPHY